MQKNKKTEKKFFFQWQGYWTVGSLNLDADSGNKFWAGAFLSRAEIAFQAWDEIEWVVARRATENYMARAIE